MLENAGTMYEVDVHAARVWAFYRTPNKTSQHMNASHDRINIFVHCRIRNIVLNKKNIYSILLYFCCQYDVKFNEWIRILNYSKIKIYLQRNYELLNFDLTDRNTYDFQ